MELVREGAARIKAGKGVFYNPKMSKLRDISVIFLKALGLKGVKLLDATTATGIRGIRYSLEAGVRDVIMLDINDDAVRSAKVNTRLNRLRLKVIGKSIQEFAGTYLDAFDVIDLDPFGSPAPMLHDLLKVSKDGTVLMVTATDTATLCGAEGNACLRIYGSQPLHNELCHEVATRILLNFAAREAAQFNFGIEPLLSISDLHYIRLFLRLRRGSKESVKAVRSSGFGAYCGRCHNFSYRKGVTNTLEGKCTNCGKGMQIFGPLWLGNLHDAQLLERMGTLGKGYPQESLRLIERIRGEADAPFSYSVPKMTSYLGLSSVPIEPVLLELGKRHAASRTHFEKDSIKTDAQIREVLKSVKAARIG